MQRMFSHQYRIDVNIDRPLKCLNGLKKRIDKKIYRDEIQLRKTDNPLHRKRVKKSCNLVQLERITPYVCTLGRSEQLPVIFNKKIGLSYSIHYAKYFFMILNGI